MATTCDHKFEARFDRKMPGPACMPEGEITPELAEAIKETVYVRDICVNCGKTEERPARYY